MLSSSRWLVECIGMFVMGMCRLPGRVLSVACGMHRYDFYRCVSVAWEIAVGSLWNVSVCCLWVCVACMGDCFESSLEGRVG